MTYRVGNHWGVTIVSEPDTTGICADRSCPDRGDHPSHEQAQLVAVVVNGDQALAERICALLNAGAEPGPVLPTAKVPTPEELQELRAAFHDGYFRERLGIWPDPAPPADSCTCTIVGPDQSCPVHHGRRARGPKPPPVGPGCICDGSGRTCPRHGTVI